MSRRDFRGAVEAPRPRAAWVMSLVASATLWATEQIPLWIILAQLASFALSYATRVQPPAILRNPIALNVGMLAITTITVRSALAGNPATVSLAFFTALAQGLQLLDARPRRSEFILVAVALFQVILASNLTDSVFFPPLVLLFVMSVTWTLLIHTLQMEAAEAGEPQAAEQAVTSDLRRMTALATTGCIVLALVLFLLLPRVKTQMMRGNLGAGLAVSGFSDSVRLGTVGQIRQDHSVVLRVESVEGELPDPVDAYWRGLAFDRFNGRSWAISGGDHAGGRRRVSGIGRFGIDLGSAGPEMAIVPDTAHRIIREPVKSGVLFASGAATRVEGPFQMLEKDSNGGIYLPARDQERVRYTVWSKSSEKLPSRLKTDHASLPLEAAAGGPKPALKYLELPDFERPLAPLATEMIGDASTDFEKAWRLQQGLRQQGRYTDSPPPLGQGTTSPIEDFLHGDLEGHCEYFASAMVMLARSQGLPARLVNGFAGGTYNPVGEFIEVTRADAHAWVEVHFEEAGWVRFDPTPPDQRLRLADAPSIWGRVTQLGSAIELWWFQRVVDFDSADQIGGLRRLWNAWNGEERESEFQKPSADSPAPKPEDESKWKIENEWMFALAAFAGLLALGLGWLRSRRQRDAESPVPETYRRALGLLEKKGFRRAPTLSARAFAAAFREEASQEAADAFDRITESYLAERFGHAGGAQAGAASGPSTELEQLERAVDGMRLRNEADVDESRFRAA